MELALSAAHCISTQNSFYCICVKIHVRERAFVITKIETNAFCQEKRKHLLGSTKLGVGDELQCFCLSFVEDHGFKNEGGSRLMRRQ
jgi:hypothetical protein